MTVQRSTLFGLIERIQRKAPEYLDLLTAETDDAFETAFSALLERAVHSMEANSKNFASLDEEGLTAALALALTLPGLTVSQESNSNGHVDLTVTADHCVPMRTKLAEAKVYDGPEKHIQGLAQLLGRYSTGREGRGLLISYVRKAGIANVVKNLRLRMDTTMPLHQQGITTDLSMRWAFLSRHEHSSGEVLDVGHISCNLFAGEHLSNPSGIN